MLAAAFRCEIASCGKAQRISGAATDSREVQSGDLFIALQGEHADGERYILQALNAGACAVLTKSKIKLEGQGAWHFVAESPEGSLLRAATFRRAKSNARVIAVSGSTGKTTVKEAISAVLGNVPHSEGNFNSGIGMPLSVLSFSEADFWVLELGINHKGEMREMVSALSPDIGVLTNVGTAHIGHFGDYNTLLAEKAMLAKGVSKGGAFVFPDSLPSFLFEREGCDLFCVGERENSTFRAENIVTGKMGTRCDFHAADRVITNLEWPIPGDIGVSVILLAAAVGVLAGRTNEQIRDGLRNAAKHTPRLRRIEAGARLLLDDSYNASPESMTAALQVLRYLSESRPRAAVLGDMLELGEHERVLHEAVGRFVAQMGVDQLFTLGTASFYIGKSALDNGMRNECVWHFSQNEAEELINAVKKYTPCDAVILFKGSHKMGLEKVVKRVVKTNES